MRVQTIKFRSRTNNKFTEYGKATHIRPMNDSEKHEYVTNVLNGEAKQTHTQDIQLPQWLIDSMKGTK